MKRTTRQIRTCKKCNKDRVIPDSMVIWICPNCKFSNKNNIILNKS